MKRLNLFLRWMVRRDDVDPGGWDSVSRGRWSCPSIRTCSNRPYARVYRQEVRGPRGGP